MNALWKRAGDGSCYCARERASSRHRVEFREVVVLWAEELSGNSSLFRTPRDGRRCCWLTLETHGCNIAYDDPDEKFVIMCIAASRIFPEIEIESKRKNRKKEKKGRMVPSLERLGYVRREREDCGILMKDTFIKGRNASEARNYSTQKRIDHDTQS